jgi:hypothetical protein
MPDGELVEVGGDHVAGPRANTDAVLWNDRQYSELGDPRFTSRSTHREYMRANGLTLADDYKGEWAKILEQRAAVKKGAALRDSSRAGDVARALDAVRNGYTPNRMSLDDGASDMQEK